jgi:hypothetical protein
MKARKVGISKRHVIQLDGSTLDSTINEYKFVPKLCANQVKFGSTIKNYDIF